MSNDDTIYHNVFSYSQPNAFDLGLYPAGEVREIVFDHAGVVRTYCSIHENMNGTIFVAPTPHFARVDASGRFRIQNVPAGRWTLRTWAERLPAWQGSVAVVAGETATVEIVLGGVAGDVSAAPRNQNGSP
jgi:hypothetical protein